MSSATDTLTTSGCSPTASKKLRAVSGPAGAPPCRMNGYTCSHSPTQRAQQPDCVVPAQRHRRCLAHATACLTNHALGLSERTVGAGRHQGSGVPCLRRVGGRVDQGDADGLVHDERALRFEEEQVQREALAGGSAGHAGAAGPAAACCAAIRSPCALTLSRLSVPLLQDVAQAAHGRQNSGRPCQIPGPSDVLSLGTTGMASWLRVAQTHLGPWASTRALEQGRTVGQRERWEAAAGVRDPVQRPRPGYQRRLKHLCTLRALRAWQAPDLSSGTPGCCWLCTWLLAARLPLRLCRCPLPRVWAAGVAVSAERGTARHPAHLVGRSGRLWGRWLAQAHQGGDSGVAPAGGHLRTPAGSTCGCAAHWRQQACITKPRCAKGLCPPQE